MSNVHTLPTARRANPVSTVCIDVKDGRPVVAVHALTREDADVLLRGLTMALVQVVAKQGA